MTDPPTLERARELVATHGWNATAYQILNPNIQHWMHPSGDGVVGHVEVGRSRVVAGEPVGPRERVDAIRADFEAHSATRGLRVVYFCAGADFAERVGAEQRRRALWIGAQPTWDPAGWAERVQGHRSLRAQLRRATNKGVRVEEWDRERAANSAALRACLERWIAARPFPTMHFLVEPRTLGRLFDRRVFVATRADEVVGFVVASPVVQRGGWLIEQIVRDRGAANGTAALLVDHAVGCFAEEGARFLTLGLAPLSRHAGIDPRHPPALGLLLGWVRAHGERFYHFQGLDFFKAKFRPDTWESIYAVSPRAAFSIRDLYAVGCAFSGGSPWLALTRAAAQAARQELRWGIERAVNPMRRAGPAALPRRGS